MYSFPLHWLAPLALALVMPMAFAQSSSQPTTPDAKNATSAAVALSYRSVFADYRAYSEQPVVSWVAANDTVGKIGGWRTYSREAGSREVGLADDSPAPGPSRQGDQP